MTVTRCLAASNASSPPVLASYPSRTVVGVTAAAGWQLRAQARAEVASPREEGTTLLITLPVEES